MSFQSEYQTHYNETDLINQTNANAKNRMTKYRDTFTFGKKSFLNTNNLPQVSEAQFYEPSTSSFRTPSNPPPQEQQQYLPSVPVATSRIHTSTNTSHINQYKSIALNLPQNDTNTAYNQFFNYVGAEPHISERIKVYNGAFGPKQEEITQAYKLPNFSAKSGRSVASDAKSVPYSYNTTTRVTPAFSQKSNPSGDVPPLSLQNRDTNSLTQLVPNATAPSSSYLYSSIEDRPQIRSYDFRPVWIPKKYPGRNMFYSHLDSSIFPGKYDVTEQVWNSLSEVSETNREKSNSSSKIDQIIHNAVKTEYQQVRVPGFTKNSGFIINPVDKSILPVMKTDHVKAAEVTKTNKFIDSSLYHFP